MAKVIQSEVEELSRKKSKRSEDMELKQRQMLINKPLEVGGRVFVHYDFASSTPLFLVMKGLRETYRDYGPRSGFKIAQSWLSGF